MVSLYYKTPKDIEQVKQIERYGKILKPKQEKKVKRDRYRLPVEMNNKMHDALQRLKIARDTTMNQIIIELLDREIKAAKLREEIS